MKDFFNKFFKNKILMISIVTILIIILFVEIIVGIIQLREKRKNNEIINNYVVYININPLIKVKYKETCINKECSEPIVTKYDLVNKDAKSIYKDINLLKNGNRLNNVIFLVCEIANEKNIAFDEIDLYTNWKSLKDYLKNNSSSEKEYLFNINVENIKKLNEIANEISNDVKTYKVTFDSDGGTEVGTQKIKKGEYAKQPTEPIKDGYKFIEWQLDDNSFDFNTPIKKDITLKAKWEKLDGNVINLNDNIQYYESHDSGKYVYPNPTCLNKTINDLKKEHKNYDKNLNSDYLEEELEIINNSVISLNQYGNAHLLTYFPDCLIAIPNTTLNLLKSLKGIIIEKKTNTTIQFKYINFTNQEYNKYLSDKQFYKYGLLIDGGYNSNEVTETTLLTETVCQKYNLICDRW